MKPGLKADPVTIGGQIIAPGTRATVDLELPKLYTHTPLAMPVHVVHGRRPGPRLFVTAAIHGDELNGVEIIRRLLKRRFRGLRGTLIAVPIVNVHGVLQRSRYLPDGRDLNRFFPGSETGSLASRLCHLFIHEVARGADVGIDLHTATRHRDNLPQVRAYLDDQYTRELAEAFGAPVIIHSELRDGSLREGVREMGIPVLVFEGGEALRYDEPVIRVGVRGVVAVMRALGMLPSKNLKRRFEPVTARSSSWVRAPASGMFRAEARLGQSVEPGTRLGIVADPFGENETEVKAPVAGVVISQSHLPLVHEGEALYHLAAFHASAPVEDVVEAYQETFGEPTDPSDGTT